MSKEYEIKTKMKQEQLLQLKVQLLLAYDLKIVIYWGEGGLIFGWRGEGNKNLAVEGSLLGEYSSWWLRDGGIIKFLAGEGGDYSPYPSPVGKTMQSNFGLSQVLGSILGPQIFLVRFTSCKLLDIVPSYLPMQFKGKLMNQVQTWENGKRINFGPAKFFFQELYIY